MQRKVGFRLLLQEFFANEPFNYQLFQYARTRVSGIPPGTSFPMFYMFFCFNEILLVESYCREWELAFKAKIAPREATRRANFYLARRITNPKDTLLVELAEPSK